MNANFQIFFESNRLLRFFVTAEWTARKATNVMIKLAIFLLIVSSYQNFRPISLKNDRALLIISYDGFHPDYLNRNVTPNLNKFRDEGTSAQFMFNVFPTKTFVNHFTIATVSIYSWPCTKNKILVIGWNAIKEWLQLVLSLSIGSLSRNSWCVVQ